LCISGKKLFVIYGLSAFLGKAIEGC
jgi:hypothetical protein